MTQGVNGDRDARRLELLHEIAKATGGRPNKPVELSRLGLAIGFSKEQSDEASEWLVDKELARWHVEGEWIQLTRAGTDQVEKALSEPETSTPGMPPAAQVINLRDVVISSSFNRSGRDLAGSNLTKLDGSGERSLRSKIVWGIGVAFVVSVAAGYFVIFSTPDGDDSFGEDSDASHDPPETVKTLADDDTVGEGESATGDDGTTTGLWPDTAVTCGGEPCAQLRVEGTSEDPGGDGLWIRDCVDESGCVRRALAAEGDSIFAVCRVTDGMPVYGNTVWVKIPWHFLRDSISQSAAVAAETTGESDRESDDFGWATSHYLTPDDAIAALPLCE